MYGRVLYPAVTFCSRAPDALWSAREKPSARLEMTLCHAFLVHSLAAELRRT